MYCFQLQYIVYRSSEGSVERYLHCMHSINHDDAQMAGLKRSYPFSIEDAPVPSFNCKFPPTYASHVPRTGESASFSNDGTFDFVQANPVVM